MVNKVLAGAFRGKSAKTVSELLNSATDGSSRRRRLVYQPA